jgi:hypothetical protein
MQPPRWKCRDCDDTSSPASVHHCCASTQKRGSGHPVQFWGCVSILSWSGSWTCAEAGAAAKAATATSSAAQAAGLLMAAELLLLLRHPGSVVRLQGTMRGWAGCGVVHLGGGQTGGGAWVLAAQRREPDTGARRGFRSPMSPTGHARQS